MSSFQNTNDFFHQTEHKQKTVHVMFARVQHSRNFPWRSRKLLRLFPFKELLKKTSSEYIHLPGRKKYYCKTNLSPALL